MNLSDLFDLAEAGEPALIYRYLQEIGRPSRTDVVGREHQRYVERALLVGIARARELGKLALRGQGDRAEAPGLAQLGIDHKVYKQFAVIGPEHMTDDEFTAAMKQAVAERRPSRDYLLELVMQMRAPGIPDGPRSDRNELLTGHRRLRPDRVVAQTVDALRGACAGVELLTTEDYDSLDQDSIHEWSRELHECKRVLNQLAKELSTRA